MRNVAPGSCLNAWFSEAEPCGGRTSVRMAVRGYSLTLHLLFLLSLSCVWIKGESQLSALASMLYLSGIMESLPLELWATINSFFLMLILVMVFLFWLWCFITETKSKLIHQYTRLQMLLYFSTPNWITDKCQYSLLSSLQDVGRTWEIENLF